METNKETAPVGMPGTNQPDVQSYLNAKELVDRAAKLAERTKVWAAAAANTANAANESQEEADNAYEETRSAARAAQTAAENAGNEEAKAEDEAANAAAAAKDCREFANRAQAAAKDAEVAALGAGKLIAELNRLFPRIAEAADKERKRQVVPGTKEQMTKHTPGPWRVGDAGFTIFGPPNGQPSPVTIAHVKRREDAALIATLPELLAALRVASAIIEAARTDGPDFMFTGYAQAHAQIEATLGKVKEVA